MSDLHDKIMNIPACISNDVAYTVSEAQAYKVGHRDARHAAAELASAVEEELDTKNSKAYEYAKALVTSIWEKHYKESCPQWEPCDNLMGVLSQLDNMLVGHPPIPQAGHVGYFDVYDGKDGDKHYIHIKDKYADGSSVRLYAAAPSLPEGWQPVPKDIHPLGDIEGCEAVFQLLKTPPSAAVFTDPLDWYAHWWKLLVAAAPKPKEFP